MSYNYKLKDPVGKLRAIVLAHLAKMRTLGRGPNREVTFTSDASGDVAARGWLVEDPSPTGVHRRYLLLENGDVWVAGSPPDATGAGPEGWLREPTDELVMLLPKSLLNAQMGGQGFLVAEEGEAAGPVVVEDRRREPRPYEGPEKRRGR